MGYKQIANVFGPLMVDEDTGALLVDAGGFVIEADIIDADMNAITGAAPNNATLHDILSGQEYAGGGLYDMLESNLYHSMAMRPRLEVLSEDLYYLLDHPMAMQPWLATVVDFIDYVEANTIDRFGSGWTVAEAAALTYSTCDWGLIDYMGSMNPYLYDIRSNISYGLFDQVLAWGVGDWMADLVDDGGRTGASSPLHDTDSPNLPAADILGDIYGKINTMESNIAAVKAQIDKLTFDGSNHLEVHTN